MKVISCKTKRNTIIYEFESNNKNVFYKSLPKKVIANEAIKLKRLRKVADKLDKKKAKINP